MNPGQLIAFEGLDGCGKTTQAASLVAALRAAGHRPVATREPTDSATGRRIRERVRAGHRVEAQEELRWFLEDRRVHVERTIAPALASGRTVVTDRYTLSSVAYQGARGLDWRRILEEGEAEFPLPDLVLLLELDAETALARVRGRGAGADALFEKREFLERVAEIFRAIDRPYVERIPAAAPAEVVSADVLECVRRRLRLP